MATDLTIKVPEELRAAMESAAQSDGKPLMISREEVEDVVDRAIHGFLGSSGS